MTATSLSQRKYLTTVLDESLQLFPPVPGTALRRVPKGRILVCGKFLPQNVGFPPSTPNYYVAYNLPYLYIDLRLR